MLTTQGRCEQSNGANMYRHGLIALIRGRRVRGVGMVDWFNNRQLLEPIGNIPPAEAEERYHAMLEEPAMAA